MKIVDRKTFMRMPKGTVFCKFPRLNEATRSYGDYLFGISEPYVKMDDTEFKFAVSNVDATGCLSDLDFTSIKAKLNLYRKVVSFG